MSKKIANPNAKEALNQMKLEIANEIGISSKHVYGANNTSHINGELGGRVGGQMSKRLVQMGEEALIKMYQNNNK